MKIKNANIGDVVFGKNGFKLKYTITKVRKHTVDVTHDTGLCSMRGSKMVPDLLTYIRVNPKNLRGK